MTTLDNVLALMTPAGTVGTGSLNTSMTLPPTPPAQELTPWEKGQVDILSRRMVPPGGGPEGPSMLNRILGHMNRRGLQADPVGLIQGLLGRRAPNQMQSGFVHHPFGTASIGSPDATSPSGRGGGSISTSSGPNTGGVTDGLTGAEAVSSGFNALGDTPMGGPISSIGGMGETGLNMGPDVSNVSGNLGAVTSPSQSGMNIGISPSAVAAAIESGAPVSVSPSGVVSIGGEAVGVIGGESGGGGGGGGIGGGGDGGGYGGDSSSNAGIGGPGGTGVAGGIGAAAGEGAGTGGVGEGERFGNQFTVPGRGPPDSVNLKMRVSPGELVTVTPPGRGLGPRDPRGKDTRSGMGELETILKYMAAR